MTSCATSDKLFLALNYAEERTQVVLGTASGVLFSEEILCPGQSIRHLPTAVDRALRVSGARVKDLAGIACVRGPGSFTGLRIAHSAMYGLSRPFSIPMAGLGYHQLLARQAAALTSGETWVLTYARKGQVYVQGFTGSGPLCPLKAMRSGEAREVLLTRPETIFLLGSGVRKNADLQDIPARRILPASLDALMPASLLEAALTATYSSETPAPLYLRKSDAEDNLEAIASARGIPAEEARRNIFDFE